jgi:nitronate monooxygenase
MNLDVPVVQAPMSRRSVNADITATREPTQHPFGVNVFAPSGGPADRNAVHRFADRLRDQAAALGVVLGDPRFDQDHYQQKVELLTQEPVAVVSFTFGPTPSVVQRLQQAGTAVWVTVTDPQEALHAGRCWGGRTRRPRGRGGRSSRLLRRLR